MSTPQQTSALASLSLDLDNKWSYLKTHGNAGWDRLPSYLNEVVPRILDFLAARQLKITFFIVGQDAELAEHHQVLRSIAEAGHDIGNHSFNHEPWLHLYTAEKLDADLARAETAILQATGVKPRGFRGPGFSLSQSTLDVLIARGYDYDCSVFPNLLNPLARAYFFATSNLSAEEKEQRKALFGTWKDALRSIKPFKWRLQSQSLLEVPVTTMPVFKVPIHLSYILYLARFSQRLALWYFGFALWMCRITASEPSILLHPLDFMGREDDEELQFFPGMDMALNDKLTIVDQALAMLAKHHRVVTMAEHVAALNAREPLPAIEPKFSV